MSGNHYKRTCYTVLSWTLQKIYEETYDWLESLTEVVLVEVVEEKPKDFQNNELYSLSHTHTQSCTSHYLHSLFILSKRLGAHTALSPLIQTAVLM